MRTSVATFILLALATTAGAQQKPAADNPLTAAKSVRCSFPNYAAVKWNGTTGEALGGTQDFAFRVEGFDFRRNRAEMVGDSSIPVALITTPLGLHVIEQTIAGNITVTTIFAGTASGEGRTYLAVHSRHLGKDGDLPARASQAYGTCQLQ